MLSSDVLIELWELLERAGVDAAALHGTTRMEDLHLSDESRCAIQAQLAERLGCPLTARLFELATLNDVIDAIVSIGHEARLD